MAGRITPLGAQLTQPTRATGASPTATQNLLAQILSGQGASTGGIIPPGTTAPQASAVLSPAQQAMARTTTATPQPTVNPNTGVPQAPAGAGFLERMKFKIQNDPAVGKALTAGGLKLLGGGSKSFARNVSNAGLAGLQTLENQRNIQRQNVQTQKAGKITQRQTKVQEGTLKESTRANKAAEVGRTEDRKQRAADNAARTKAINNQTTATQARTDKIPFQERLFNAQVKELQGQENPNTNKKYTANEAENEIIRNNAKPSRQMYVSEGLANARKNAIGGVLDPKEKEALVAALQQEYTDLYEAQASSPGLNPTILKQFRMEAFANGVPFEGKLWTITDITGDNVTLTAPGSSPRTESLTRLQAPEVSVANPTIAPSPPITPEALQQAQQQNAERISQGASAVGSSILDVLKGPPASVVQANPRSIL